jgi:hypothetical protein
MSDLFEGSASAGQTIAGYRVTLGAGGGTLLLGTQDVTSQTSFTADQFRQLTYRVGTNGSQSLTVAAQTGTLLSDGTLTQEIDSPAVQITANVTGTRSINAMNALSTVLSDTDPDAGTVSLAQQAGIFTGWSGATRPTLQTDGNFTAVGGDHYQMSQLFTGSASAGQTIVGYRVALDGSGDGQLLLNGKPTDLSEFSDDDFRQLTYVAGSSGSQNLTVVAQTGTLLSDGSLTQEIDSAAVQITANVTGTRSINAMNALSTQLADTDPDADTVSIVQQAGIFTGWSGASRPTLQTDGNFAAVGGDKYQMSQLFTGSAPAGQAIAGYCVALGAGGGTLLLGTQDVTSQTTPFTADEFRQLTYVAGTGGSQSLTVVAQIGTLLSDGTLTQEIDSPAVQITANVTGTRSINAMNALSNASETDPDANTISIAQQAGIFTGWSGATRPTLQTDGNFTAVGGDNYQMSQLFKGSASAGQAIVGYRVALDDGGDGQLLLNGKLTDLTEFSDDDFRQLTYVAGSSGSQNLTVVAQTGTLLSDGSLTQEIDSPAVQITANVTGTRSINAMNALSNVSETDPNANTIGIAQQAGIFTGWSGATRPSLQTDGNFTAVGGDHYQMSQLFTGSASAGQTIVGYRVALDDGGDGQLLLNGKPTDLTEFSDDDFRQLAYVAGTSGSQNLTVVAQTGTLQSDGTTITQEIDSPAVQITANVTGTRSINAMNALSTQLANSDPDANTVSIAQQAGIFTGWSGATRPILETALDPDPPLPLSDLQNGMAPIGQQERTHFPPRRTWRRSMRHR